MSNDYNDPSGKQAGYGINLYRNTRDGVIAGVCAGLADHFKAQRWQVRLLALTALLFLPGPTLLAYIAAWLLLAERPEDRDDAPPDASSDHVFNYRRSAAEELKQAKRRLQKLDRRLIAMERYVTSSQFQLRQEINRMKD